MSVRTVAMLTAGGLAPCLSSAVAGLIERYTEIAPDVELLAYTDGYAGLLTGTSVKVTREIRASAGILHRFGGSPIGNSRVKLTNVEDCVRRGLVAEGQDPLQMAAEQLTRDRVDVLHTIGGDDTNTTAADLAAYLKANGYDLTVVGLPKTVDNDVVPVRQSLGAWTAAEQGALFARNVIAEHSANPRMFLLHEVMGRNCGWLTAATARNHHEWVARQEFVPGMGNDARRWDVHGVYLPELSLDIEREGARLRSVMDELGCVNVFQAEGAGTEAIVAQMEAEGQSVPRDPFGHIRLDKVNTGAWFAERFAEIVGAEKVLVQKSGHFSRSAPAGPEDLRLIQSCVDLAVECALRGEGGVIGHDEQQGGRLRAIEFERISGGKAFDTDVDWFVDLLKEIDQPRTATG